MSGMIDMSLVDVETREGYYRDVKGDWRMERRINPDRRATTFATKDQKALRKDVRRETDKELLKFLETVH